MARARVENIAVVVSIVLFASFGALLSAAMGVPRVAAARVDSADLPPRTGIWPVNITLYGSASGGWGSNASALSNPGPTITVYLSDIVNLTLISTDTSAVRHTWFIDYNGDNLTNPGEPSSPDFTSAQTLVWNFTAGPSGSWVYKCVYHQTSMTGKIVILSEPRPVTLTFSGSAAGGWGFSSGNQSNPGPRLVVLSGTKVNLTLISTDTSAVRHTWFIDYNGDNLTNPGEPSSPDFTSAQTLVWNFTAGPSGSWVYKCVYHQTSMTGGILIVGGPPLEFPRGALPLITAIMLGALASVLVFAVVYHVRAVRAAKRMR